LFELRVKASLIKSVEERAETKTTGECKQPTDAVGPKMITGNDDA
jgi:hypothetical protein